MYAAGNEDERRAEEHGFNVRDGRDDECGDALRGLCFDAALKDITGEADNFNAGWDEVREGAAFTDEDGFEGLATAEGLLEEVFAFNGDKTAAKARLPGEGCAKLLDAGVGPAGYDFTVMTHHCQLTPESMTRRRAVCSRARRSRGMLAIPKVIVFPQEQDHLTAEILRIDSDEPEPALIDHVVNRLQSGEVVALPTDTFYGLAVDPMNLWAVDRIYDIKSRARHKPLSLLIADVAQAYGLARGCDHTFDRLAERFWPGPLTIIVKAGSKLPLRVTANTGNVALRVPEAAIARAVVAKLGLPITATSANLHGLPECTYANCVREQLGNQIPLIVDGGPTARAIPTTIVDLSGTGGSTWTIMREGAIPTHEIALCLQR